MESYIYIGLPVRFVDFGIEGSSLEGFHVTEFTSNKTDFILMHNLWQVFEYKSMMQIYNNGNMCKVCNIVKPTNSMSSNEYTQCIELKQNLQNNVW